MRTWVLGCKQGANHSKKSLIKAIQQITEKVTQKVTHKRLSEKPLKKSVNKLVTRQKDHDGKLKLDFTLFLRKFKEWLASNNKMCNARSYHTHVQGN